MTVLCDPAGKMVAKLDFPVAGYAGRQRWTVPLHPPIRPALGDMSAKVDISLYRADVESGKYLHPDGREEDAIRFLDQGSLDAWKAWKQAWRAESC